MLEAMEDVVNNFGYPVSDQENEKKGKDELSFRWFVRADNKKHRVATAGFLRDHLRDQCGALYGDHDDAILQDRPENDPIDLMEELCGDELKVCPKDIFRSMRDSLKEEKNEL